MRVGLGDALWAWLADWQWVWYLVELVLVLPQPLPFQVVDPLVSMTLGLAMFLRFFWVVAKLFKEYSPFSRTHQTAVGCFAGGARRTRRTGMLPFKALLFISPMQFLAMMLVVGAFVFGYAIYIAEREWTPTMFTFPNSLYLSSQIIITGWAVSWEPGMVVAVG